MDFNPYDLNAQCEEFYGDGISEEEKAEVMAMIVAENEASAGYNEWSESLEESEKIEREQREAEEGEKDWLGTYRNRLPGPKAGALDI
jgi:hypothetical protein